MLNRMEEKGKANNDTKTLETVASKRVRKDFFPHIDLPIIPSNSTLLLQTQGALFVYYERSILYICVIGCLRYDLQ